jgi:hypothetical protein
MMSIVGIKSLAIPREQQAAHCLPVLFDPPTHPFRARADSEIDRALVATPQTGVPP